MPTEHLGCSVGSPAGKDEGEVMASIEAGTSSQSHQKHKHKHTRTRRLGIRIDMTPMVDVAFLLLTFFMLATTLSRHQIMEINYPKGDSIPVLASRVLMLLVDEENTIYWNIGFEKPVKIPFVGLKELIIEQYSRNSELITLLKFDRKAKYRSLIDILDELQLAKVGRYSIAPLQKSDRDILKTIPS